MIETMHEYHGVGLAAPQVHEGLRLFVALLDEDPGAEERGRSSIINPEIMPDRDHDRRRAGRAASAFPTSAAWCRASPTSPCARSTATARRSSCSSKDFAGARRPARDRSSRRRAVLRPNDVDAVADLSRRVLALSRQGRRRLN